MSDNMHAAGTSMAARRHDGSLRVLLLTNEDVPDDHPAGQVNGFTRLRDAGDIEAFDWIAPKVLAKSLGEVGALSQVLELIRARGFNVVVQGSPRRFPFTAEWFEAVSRTPSNPILLYWEGDAWSRWSKPPAAPTRLWWSRADVVFTVAFGQQRELIRRLGGRDVRFVPNTYDHVRYATEESEEPATHGEYSDVILIGNWWGNRYLPSRLPGARQRFRLVRGLQRDSAIPLAIYGRNWNGRGVKGPIPRSEQAAVARSGLLTANWDHFPRYAAYQSDRLGIQLLAGRAHITTLHPESDWLPGPDTGLFLEPTVDAAIRRVRELLSRPQEEVLELGLAAHHWVRHRLSDRELALYMLGAVDERLLRRLPEDPWARLPI